MRFCVYVSVLCAVLGCGITRGYPKDAPARTVDFSVELHDEHGNAYPFCAKWASNQKDCEKVGKTELSDLVLTALNASGGDAKTQVITYQLVKSIVDGKPIALSAEQAARIISALWSWRTTLISRGNPAPVFEFGQAVEMVDPQSAVDNTQ